ncbi:MAG: glucose-6-phosphate dehydrogenase assembly protein OpcA [Bryobacteraceae bacterium]
MSATIHPEAILRDLSELWVSLGKQHDGEHTSGVLRACAMTLIVIVDASEDPNIVGETLAALMREHPSRAIVVRLKPSAERILESRVFAQCWMPFATRRQICCEQIEITASHASLADVPPVILALAVPDLPVILWCRALSSFPLPAISPFHPILSKMIVDGTELGSPVEALEQLKSRPTSPAVADLTWTRITRWRQLIAQIFENPEYLSRLREVSEVRISHAGSEIPLSAYYLAGWILESLSGFAIPKVRFEPVETNVHGRLAGVELRGEGPDALRVTLERGDGNTARVRVDGLENCALFPRHTDYELLREELSIAQSDAVYERMLPNAMELALGKAK